MAGKTNLPVADIPKIRDSPAHRLAMEDMNLSKLARRCAFSWIVEPSGSMRVPVVIN